MNGLAIFDEAFEISAGEALGGGNEAGHIHREQLLRQAFQMVGKDVRASLRPFRFLSLFSHTWSGVPPPGNPGRFSPITEL